MFLVTTWAEAEAAREKPTAVLFLEIVTTAPLWVERRNIGLVISMRFQGLHDLGSRA